MSFRIKLGALLSFILLLNLGLAMTSWWSTDNALRRHERINSFTVKASTLLQVMNHGPSSVPPLQKTGYFNLLAKAAGDLRLEIIETGNIADESLKLQLQQLADELLVYQNSLKQLKESIEKDSPPPPSETSEQVPDQEGFAEEVRTLELGVGNSLQTILKQHRDFADGHLESQRLWVLSISMLGVIVSLVIAFMFSARFTALLAQLRKSAEGIADGDLTTAVKIDRRDDIGQLADIFNRMTEKLRRNFNEIEEYRDNLEELVSARTSELENEILERRSTEKALRSNEEYLRTIIDQSPMGIIVWDTNFQISQWSKRSEEIFGYTTKDATGLPAKRLLPKTMHPHIDKIWQKLITTESGVRSRNENITRDGKVILCDWFNTPISDAFGNILGALSLIENVTERLQEEKELIKIEKLESTGILAGGIAHDFNNILTAILGNINIALRDKNLSDSTRELLSSAEQASIRARVVTRQLLTFAKGGEPVVEPVALGEIIRESTDFVLNSSKVNARYNIPDDLWQVPVDRGQISQVIENIVLNSRQAMIDGGEVEIICENVMPSSNSFLFLDKTTPFVRIIIRDNGPGIPEKVLDKIFDPYFSTKEEGSGLGLAVSLSIVNKHNGRIMVNSEPSRGAQFTLYLPAISPGSIKHQSENEEVDRSKSCRVLVMDDDESVRRVLEIMLELLGHRVFLASDGKEAITIYRDRLHSEESIDLVIADLTIPGGMGGKEAIRELLKIDPGIRAIVSSGYSSDPVMASCREYGFQVAVTKPYVLEKLEEAISVALSDQVNGA